MANPYEYPPPTLPPPPPPPPPQAPAPPPPPVYTYPIPYPLPSNIPSPYQPVFPSPPQLYPPFPQPAFQFNLSAQPVAFYPAPQPPTNYHYGTLLLTQPQPYAYLRPFPYDPFSAADPVQSVGNEGLLPAQTSSSLSIQPVNHLLHNIRLSDPPLLAPSPPSHRRKESYDYQYQPSSDKPVGSPPPENPAGEEAIVPLAGPGAIVPFAGPGAIVPFAGFGAIVPFAGHEAIVPFSALSSEPESGAIVPYEGKPKGKTSLKVLLLHGSLDIWVYEAMNLPNMDLFHKRLGDMLGARITNSITGKVDQVPITSDPYVSIMLCDAAIGRTYVVSNSENPAWMQHFNVPVAHPAAEIEFVVKDSDVVGAQLIGSVYIPTEQIYSGEKVEGAFPILGTNGKQCKPGAFLRLSIQYIPMNRLSIYHHGGGAGPEYWGVPNTYFPLRKGGNVTLYQDAHVPDGCLPDLRLGNGMHYQHGKCWYDIFDAISNARRLIYIGGWSVYHTVRLVRDSGNSPSPILGDLLKLKSQEGVRVLLLVWDDPTSRSILGYRTDGVMGTRDEETRRFFKHSTVQVLLCPRSAGKKHSFVKQHETGTIYTHHQKQVVVDADAGNNRRKIVAFIGGLDLCGGRYDTPEHPIFRTLQTVHKDDYHNPNFVNYDESGPREPWHDMHCRIDGPAAYDVLQNFEERWLKAAKNHGIKKLKKSDDSLLSIDRIPDIIGIDDTIYRNDNDPETWHVQIFRSIDSNSAKGFPRDPSDASNKNLVCGKNVLIDMSIHQAYVHAIRAAQHFIYIENQYFLGSSFSWDSNKNLGANNLIPIEIAFKIANKIRANERFTAYIVIPMWPEGNPTGAPTQRILFWQHKTMQMMYETIYTALKEVGIENTYEPQDYLNFFCLGTREVSDLNNSNQIAENSAQALAKKSRRFMIYVHSKGMIVDDEYVIIGSANINQRSLEGTRDTEIAMGAYQPEHTWARKLSGARGQIFGYRMALWAEHLGTLEECFASPESLECMRRIRNLGLRNWRQYVADDITEMKGHLLNYPVDVDRQGKVKPIPGYETFPDIGGNICGSFFGIQENLTI